MLKLFDGLITVLPIRALSRLKPDERFLLLHTYLLLGAIRLGLVTRRFKQLNRYLPHVADWLQRRWRHRFGEQWASVASITLAVRRSQRFQPGDPKCLVRALTAQTLLVSQGYAPQLKIGVSKSADGAIKAHAWIEHRGAIVIGNLPDLERYVAFPTNSSLERFLASENLRF